MSKFYNKLLKDLNSDELKQVEGEYFICLHSPQYYAATDEYRPCFKYLVMFEKNFICRFKELDKAKEYIKLMNNLG